MSANVFSPDEAAAAAQRRLESTAKSRETSQTSSTKSAGTNAGWQIVEKPGGDAASTGGTRAIALGAVRERQPIPVGLLPEDGVQALQAQVQTMEIKDKKDGDDCSMTSAQTTAVADVLPSGKPMAG